VAVDIAIRFLKEAYVDAIKLEGDVRIAERIKAIDEVGVVVVGYISETEFTKGSHLYVEGKDVMPMNDGICKEN